MGTKGKDKGGNIEKYWAKISNHKEKRRGYQEPQLRVGKRLEAQALFDEFSGAWFRAWSLRRAGRLHGPGPRAAAGGSALKHTS